jgi:energy-coupling factor transporter ATP-binding protein EcfA2
MEGLLGQTHSFSLEIVSTRKGGIRYLIRTETKFAAILKQHLLSYLPQVTVREGIEYVSVSTNQETKSTIHLSELTLTKHALFPLQPQSTLDEHDPVAYITGAMTKIDHDELIAMQIIITPTRIADTEKIKRMIFRGEDVLGYLNKFTLPRSIWILLTPLWLISKLMLLILTLSSETCRIILNDFLTVTPSSKNASQQPLSEQEKRKATLPTRPVRMVTPFEQTAIDSINQKIEQNIFQSTIRFIVIMNDPNKVRERENGLLSSLAMFTSSTGQALRKRMFPLQTVFTTYLFFLYRNRLHSLLLQRNSPLLSISEIAALYHFPYSLTTQTENIVTLHSKSLPAPLSLKQRTPLDVSFAMNTYGGTSTSIGLTEDERKRHMYIIGATGTGKSTVLLSMLNQDIIHNKGVCLIDPHGDIAEAAVHCVPTHRLNDLIYINPYDISYPVGINLLELTPGLSDDDALMEKEFIAESVISLFRKLFSSDTSTTPHRIEYILRNTIHTAFYLQNPTLFTVFELLTNTKLQKKAVKLITDEQLKNFWTVEFGKAGDFQKVKMVSPVTAKIGRFLFSPSAKRILEQTHSTINFDDILDNKKFSSAIFPKEILVRIRQK